MVSGERGHEGTVAKGSTAGVERRRLRLLLVEDSPSEAGHFQEMVADINGDPTCEYLLELQHVSGMSAARAALEQGTPDAALLGLTLPDAAGLEAVRLLEPLLLEKPIIVLAAPEDYRLAFEAIRMGVQDYLLKGRVSGDLLIRSVRYAIERQRMAALLRSAAFVDELTGLYNRRGFLRLAEHQVKLSRRKGRGYSVTFVDLDGLKKINDLHGHLEGDEALREAAEVLRASFRESDVLARTGGDEFVALTIETDAEDEQPIRERLLRSIARHNARSGKPYSLGMGVGISYQEHTEEITLEELLARAEAAMGEQKRAGRAERQG
jgi:two-component system cell cycle response regulator